MTDALPTPAGPRNSPWRVWPLLAAAVAISAGVSIGPQLSAVAPDGPLHTLLALVGGLLLLGGAVVHLRTPDAPPGPPFIGLASAAAALTALQTIDPSVTPTTPVGLFLLIGPWRYLLIPAAVHFALTVAWSHQGRVWLGVVTGWYALHLALFIATAGGLLFGEAPLLRVVDGFFLRQILEPIGATIAIGALLLALASRNRRQSQRRAVLIALATLLLGLVPVILFSLVPEARMLIGLPPTLAMASLPVLVIGGVSAISALPMVNPEKRDLIAHRTAQRLLEEGDLTAGLRDVAERLAEIFEAEGVVIRLGVPAVEVTAGAPRRARPEGLFTPDPETFEERRAVVVPIGRGADPLGEAYLEGRFPGAFGRREREWLLAFLGPISSAVRVRRREAERVMQLTAFATDAATVSRDLAHAVGLIPELTTDEGRRVPLPVDASEVLGQLATGSLSIRQESEALERAADEARGHARAATDAIARAMDGMARLGNELTALERHGDAIAIGNETVNGVAFRTNLLANTAALEASRAGAAGRTFAVLAEEIRRLADATAEATAAIEAERAAMTRDAAAWHAQLELLRVALTEAVREAEASEETVRRIAALAGTVESAARALGPPIEEANAVARRRSARDAHLTATFEGLVSERSRLAAALASHRDATDRLGEQLERLARAGRGRGRAAPR